MIYLDYPGQPPRAETDVEVIATLVRKGWTARPPQPEHDPATHAARWDGAQWIVEPLPPPAVPESVPAHHFAIAVELRGLTDRVDAWLATKPRVYQIAWQRTPSFSPDSMMLAEARSEIGISDEEFAAVWATARQVRT